MKFLEDESVFIALILLAGSVWFNHTQPSLFTQFLVLVTFLATVFMALRMSWSRNW